MFHPKKALVLLSGGQDSATCLAWSLKNFQNVITLSFNYGQRHQIELEKANKLSKIAKVEHFCLDIPVFSDLSQNALTCKKIPIQNNENGPPNTFVPGRNLLFLSLAASFAYSKHCSDLVTGVCQADYSGYPDCRENFIQSVTESISLALEKQFTIHTPLMHLSKAESIHLMQSLKKMDWYKHTHTCYEGVVPPCGKCPACILRQKGFDEAKVIDPLLAKL